MAETLYRKYRPITFADVSNQVHIKRTLQNQLRQGTLAHAYLFAGPRGVGKTTVARIFAKAVNCEKLKDGEPCNTCSSCRAIIDGKTMDVYEIDAASHTGVDNVRENIIDAVRFAPSQLKRKVYIIDEVHMLSTSAFNALLKTLEEPPAYAIFILATTELHKVPETIISRCQRFDFHRHSVATIVERLQELAKQENIKADEDVLQAIARRAEGGMRDAESVFGQILALADGKKVGMEEASLVLPLTDEKSVQDFLEAVLAKNATDAMTVLHEAQENGVRFSVFEDVLLERLRDQMIHSLTGADGATQQALPAFQQLIERLLVYRRQYASERFPQLPLELLVADWCSVMGSSLSRSAAPAEGTQTKKQVVPASLPVTPETLPPPSLASLVVPEVPVNPVVPPVSPSAAESPVISENALTITLEDIRRRWDDCRAIAKERSGTLPMILQEAELVSLEGNTLNLGMRVRFLADQLNESRNRNLLIDILRGIFQQPILVSAQHMDVAEEAVVADLLGEFGGTVVS